MPRHRHTLFAILCLPLAVGGCVANAVPAGDGVAYRLVTRVDHVPADPGAAAGRRLALAPDGRMKWVAAPTGWAALGGGWSVPPQARRTPRGRGAAPAVYEAVEAEDGFVLPVSGAILTSTFGMREHPILGGNRLHAGIDLAAPTGTPVRAAVAGTVQTAAWNGGYGNYVRIAHGGVDTAYAHLNGFAPGIAAGTAVAAGDVIGYVGSTGRSTGPPQPFAVLVGEDAIDPMSNMPARVQVALGAQPRTDLARGGP
ncbi:MAG: M23 family metallopeptidase [Alphaproteobacteria bacterium]